MNIKPQLASGPALAWRRSLATMMMACASLHPAPARADPPRRVVSINLCTDQLLLALGQPEQIAGLGRFSQNAEMSFMAPRAGDFPSIRGGAEEVLHLKPDLVLAGSFSGRATREILAGRGVRVETFAPPRTIAEARAEIERAGRLLGATERTAAMLAGIDAAVTQAQHRARQLPTALLALPMQRRGYASGKETLLSAAMTTAGFRNAAAELGISGVGHLSLETIAKMKLDALIVEDLPVSKDQSSAILQHPVLRARGGTSIVRLPVAEVTCGGPSLAPLIRRLSAHVR